MTHCDLLDLTDLQSAMYPSINTRLLTPVPSSDPHLVFELQRRRSVRKEWAVRTV